MKKIYLILLGIIVICIGAYFYLRFRVLKAKDFKPEVSKARSVTDLRPAIIAKLQQMVKDGSDGLYYLSVEKVEPHVLTSSFDMANASIIPDSQAIRKLDSAQKLPDDLFKISFSKLHITGLVINDFLSTDHLSLNQVSITDPVIEVYHKKRAYNERQREMHANSTLYQRIMKTMRSIVVNKIELINGTFINHDLTKKKSANIIREIAIHLKDVRIDSSTQYDQKRFLFAKKAHIVTTNFSSRTPDSLYMIKCGSIDIAVPGNDITVLNFEIRPRLNKEQFEKHLTAREEMYDVKIPNFTLNNISWWELTNNESVLAKSAEINSPTLNVFLDRSLPFRKVKPNTFPHQALMKIPIPVSVADINIHHGSVTYSEYNPGMEKTGTIYLDEINGKATNFTNIPSQIRLHPLFTVKINALFMRNIPMNTTFNFDLAKYKTGNFKMDFDIGKMDSSNLNKFIGPLGEFMIKKGTLQKGVAHIEGDNFKTSGKGELLYRDLYVVGLKKDHDKPNNIKKKSITSFLGNVLLVKNNNPSKNKPPRMVDLTFDRDSKTTFLSFVWKTMLTGILETVGLPKSFANKPY
ncbi:MAG: hypothetical protein ABJA57_11600 [Ginsengibacter sp.]